MLDAPANKVTTLTNIQTITC